MTVEKVGGTYRIRRRVPKRYAGIEPRKVFKASLKTDSESEAREKAVAVWKTQVEAWELKLAGNGEDAMARYEAARNLARAKGFRYVPTSAIPSLPIAEIVRRVQAVTLRNGEPDMTEARALLGGVPKPEITVSRALDIYWRLADDKTLGKSPDQVRRWRNPRVKAITNFIEVVGDIPVAEIGRDEIREFRDWWLDRIRDEGLTANSANKDLTHLVSTLRLVNREKSLGRDLKFDGLAFTEKKGQRVAFTEAWIRDHLVTSPKLMGLNTEARSILLGMVNTGYRPSEGASLGPSQIRLDTEIPHISIEPNGRALKTENAIRVIPLAGVSLAAFRACPNGFPRYHDKAGLSATINKFLRENGLMETPEHSLYGLRHSFEDRMLDRDVDERIRRDLMGHALNRERYGKGASMEKLHSVIQKIAL